MAQIIIAGDSMTVKSAFTLEDIKTLEKYRPKALTLYAEDGKTEVFKVGSTTGRGSINQYGASFGSASKDDAKNAIITLDIPSDTTDAKAFAEDKIGVAILHLNRLEEKFGEVLAGIAEEKTAVLSNITVL